MGSGIFALPEFPGPAHPGVGIKMPHAGIGQGGEGAILEGKEGGVQPLCRPARIRARRHRPYAAHAPSAQQAHHLHLMRRLAEHHAAALRGV